MIPVTIMQKHWLAMRNKLARIFMAKTDGHESYDDFLPLPLKEGRKAVHHWTIEEVPDKLASLFSPLTHHLGLSGQCLKHEPATIGEPEDRGRDTQNDYRHAGTLTPLRQGHNPEHIGAVSSCRFFDDVRDP